MSPIHVNPTEMPPAAMNPVTVVAVGDTPRRVIDELEHAGAAVAVVRRCAELAELLAACQSGLAKAAVVAENAAALTATLVDRLAAVGVVVVAVAASPAEAARLHGIGAAPVMANVGAAALAEAVLAAVSARGFPAPAGYGVPSDVAGPATGGWAVAAGLRWAGGGGMPDGGDTAGAHPPAGGADDSAAATPAAGIPWDGSLAATGSSGSGTGQPVAGPIRADRLGEGQTRPATMDPATMDPATMDTAQTDTAQTDTGQPGVGVKAAEVPDTPSLAGRRRGAPADRGSAAASGARLGGLLRRRRSSSMKSPVRKVPGHRGRSETGGGPAPGPETIAVWGPIGSPGRTTLAVNLAAELALLGRSVLLIDADTYGASVAASLGLLDEAASFAQACRVADQGTLGAAGLARICTEVVFSGGSLLLLTGLTRADRWPELRAAAVERVLDAALLIADTVVIDCGFCLESDEELSYDTVAPRRNAATLGPLLRADTVYAVGGADAIALPRLVRALAELAELQGGTPGDVRVVLNKVRRHSVGGSPVKALEQAWERFGPAQPIDHFLPWDPELADRALLEGRLLLEAAPDSALRAAIRTLGCAHVQGKPETAVSSATARSGITG